ncbi:hybrid sensor histidine kinase/response regulator [Sorangium cellulosum]|uniref:histidine kinase n=1 Tax=Sorangium cellulosum TaxID=56 RepID=A0A150Q6J8_SORCE|nr:response regulator [Sorangium cellulosum]KYF63590.1 hybrid sensor histidine kinase/response regulator [Sorangium cellulosum]
MSAEPGRAPPAPCFRLLLIEDSAIAASIVQSHLDAVPWQRAELAHAETLAAGLARVKEGWDVVLLDLGLPDGEGLEVVERVRDVDPRVPIVVLTGHDDVGLAERALGASVQDYLVKRRLDADALWRAIRHAVSRQQLVTQLARTMAEARELRLRLERSERLAAVGQLAAGVAHEINNPLAYVVANLELLAREIKRLADTGAPTERLGQPLADACHGAARVMHIVRDLGVFARGEANEAIGPTDVNAVIESALNIVHTQMKHRARVVRELAPISRVGGAEGRLTQVFVNLLINAAHSMGEGRVADNLVEVRTREQDREVIAEIVDSGCGVAEEHMHRLFEPFFTTKRAGEGTGLGLAICRSIVESCGGSIGISSKVGVGTCVRIRLPVWASEEPAALPARARDEGAARRGRILIVDDEPLILRALRGILGTTHEVVGVGSGAQAQRTLLLDAGFDVVLCDIVMQEGTGIELHEWMEAELPALAERVLFMTGGATSEVSRRFLAAHGGRVLAKPIEPAELVERVEALLAGRAVDAAGAA